jgi:hypothetical protein
MSHAEAAPAAILPAARPQHARGNVARLAIGQALAVGAAPRGRAETA